MPFINYKFIFTEALEDDSTMTSDQILREKQERENNFRRGLQMANTIIDNNPMILSYLWYMWTCRGREYSPPNVGEQMTRQMVRDLPFPTEEQRSLLQQYLSNFSAFLEKGQVIVDYEPVNACTLSTFVPPFSTFSRNIFDVNDENDQCLFVGLVILHELVHCVEPVHVDLEKDHLLYCSPVVARRREGALSETLFEQGEIFEMMMYGAIVGRPRLNSNTLIWQCSRSDPDFEFLIDQHEYRHIFVSYDLTIIRNIIDRKKRRVLVRNYARSIRQRIANFIGMFRR
jgi:hypothetical protein